MPGELKLANNFPMSFQVRKGLVVPFGDVGVEGNLQVLLEALNVRASDGVDRHQNADDHTQAGGSGRQIAKTGHYLTRGINSNLPPWNGVGNSLLQEQIVVHTHPEFNTPSQKSGTCQPVVDSVFTQCFTQGSKMPTSALFKPFRKEAADDRILVVH